MKKIYLIFALIFLTQGAIAQRILGGIFNVYSPFPTNYTQSRVTIYREPWGEANSLQLDWGDGTIETMNFSYTATTIYEGIVADIYTADHWYDTTGLYYLTVKDSFLVNDIVNVEQSGEQILEMRGAIRIRESLPSGIAQVTANAFYHIIEPSGSIIVPGSYGFSLPSVIHDSISQRFIPFVEEGYSLPPASDTIICCLPVIWDQPIAPGRYAFGIEMTSWLDGEILGSNMRKMTIFVDSSMLVSTYTPFVEGILSLYPNPASEKLQIEWGGFTPGKGQFSLLDVHGREWHREAIGLGAAVQSLEVDVSDWPPGLYVLRMQVGDAVLSRKVVVER